MAVFDFKLIAQRKAELQLNYFGSPAPIIATYIYRLKIKTSNTSVEERTGDNQNSQDDVFELPLPLIDNKERYIILSNELSAFNADSKYSIQLDVVQDGVITNSFVEKGEVKLNEPSHGKTILIRIN